MQNWGGGEFFLANLIEHIHSYEFLIVSPGGNVLNRFKSLNINSKQKNILKKISKRSRNWSLFQKLQIAVKVLLSTPTLIKIIISNKMDAVLANGNFAGMLALPAIIITGKPLIVVQHLIYKSDSAEHKIIRLLGKKSKNIVCVSEAVKANIYNTMEEKDRSKILVIPNGIKLPGFENENEKRDYREINLGLIGTIIKEKGIDLTIRAVAPILKDSEVIYLHIFGSALESSQKEDYLGDIKKLVNNLKLNDKIIFHGHENDHQKIYGLLDIIISYSIIPEAFPYTVLEAMAYGKIVIASCDGGIPELIKEEVDGFLVKTKDVNQLQDKIEHCINNIGSKNFDTIRANARKKISGNYSIEKFSGEYEKLFKRIMN